MASSIISIGCDIVLATDHVLPGMGIILRNLQLGGFAIRSPRDPQISATRGRVLWCTLVPPQTPLLDYGMARYYCWITPQEKHSSKVFKVATPKKVNLAPSDSNDSDTEHALHWTFACQLAHYPDNSHSAHDARLLISFAIRVLRRPPTTRKTAPLSNGRPCLVPCLHVVSHNSPPVRCFVLSPCPTTVAFRSLCHAPPRVPTCSLTSRLRGRSSGHRHDNPCRPQSSPFCSVRRQQGSGG